MTQGTVVPETDWVRSTTTEVEATILGAEFWVPGAEISAVYQGQRRTVVEQGAAPVVMERFQLANAVNVGGETVEEGELVEIRSTMTGFQMVCDAMRAKGWRGWRKGCLYQIGCESLKQPKRPAKEGEKEYSARPNFYVNAPRSEFNARR